MSTEIELSRSTLDELPLNIAVLDETGEILLTNRAWKEFARVEAGVEDPSELGGNYLDATEGANDGDADRAAAGLSAVLSGDRDEFTMEYPCHSPDERRWFLMRVTGFQSDSARYAVVAHADITDRKLAELAADEQAARLSHVLDRVNGLLADVTGTVVHARSRAAAEQSVCEQFARTDPYRFAWIGRPDLRSDRLIVHEWAGDAQGEFESQSVAITGTDPVASAYRSGEIQLIQDPNSVETAVNPNLSFEPEALVAIPLTYRSKRYGVLSAYADGSTQIDDRERTILAALGRTVATAIHALTTGRVLSAASVIETELQISSSQSRLAQLTAESPGKLTYRDSMRTDDGDLLVFVIIEGVAEETIERQAKQIDGLDARILTKANGRLLLELEIRDSLISAVTDQEGFVTELHSDDGTVSMTVIFPDEEAARAGFEYLEERYGHIELTGYREREREADTAAGFTAKVRDTLTERQLTALRTAYLSGYFEWPRPVSGDDVADSMGITRATFHQHLREAQRKLAAGFFEGEPE